jgi:hypothetical protein
MSLVMELVAQLEQLVVLLPQVGTPLVQLEEVALVGLPPQVGTLLVQLGQLVVLLPQVGTLLVQLEEQVGTLLAQLVLQQLEPRVQ